MDTQTAMGFDIQAMKQICLADIDKFASYAEKIETPNGVYFFKDNGAKVLAVAHLDFVPKNRFFESEGAMVYCPQLDDRLGAYTVLVELEKHGIKADILLTTGEEQCRSTAKFFKPAHEYNWVMEFDRPTDGIAMNQYLDDEIRGIMNEWFPYGRIDRGQYTDIVELGHLGVKCFNFGVGYERWHTDTCFADLRVLRDQLQRVKCFYDQCKDEKFEHKPEVKQMSKYVQPISFEHDFDADLELILNDTKREARMDVDVAQEIEAEAHAYLKQIYCDYMEMGYTADEIHKLIVHASEGIVLFHGFRKKRLPF